MCFSWFFRADGGVCNNDFVMELAAHLTEHTTERCKFTDMSAVGAAYLAGLAAGKESNKQVKESCTPQVLLTFLLNQY